MLQAKIDSLLRAALRELGIKDEVNFKIDVPPRKELGDYATNCAILCARALSREPMKIAEQISESLKAGAIVDKVEIAKPGFINITLKLSFIQNSLPEIIKQDEKFGKRGTGSGKRVLLEFVSANPTGPLHVGHGRWAVIGDAIGKLLEADGFAVEREYYVNNIGTQVEMLEASVKARREGKEVPEGGYGGEYIREVRGERREEIIQNILKGQMDTLEKLGVKFDRLFYESELHEKNKVLRAVEKLHDAGVTFEEEGAIWFKSKEYGDDKNRVLTRAGGKPTYFAADIAYHLDKYERGYDRLIDIWGTDHHGYVGRLKAAMKVLNQPVEKLEIIIGQLVALYRGKEQVRMSKRTGEMITLQEVIDEIGADATRFFFSATDVNSHLNFDLEIAKKKSLENPVYYLQYAHARICSILRKSTVESRKLKVELSTLDHPAERELMLKLLSWPDVVEEAAKLRHPHRITEYGKELATVFHSFYEKCRVLGDPARLFLVDCSRITLRNVLELLGISAPESM